MPRWGREPPPLARGRPGFGSGVLAASGTTPAGAGPTRRRRARCAGPTNHPRWRGADSCNASFSRSLVEPPPLARGRRARQAQQSLEPRTTPAGAGPTWDKESGWRWNANHPRWRGADWRTARRSGTSAEPPPLARGRQQQRPQRHRLRRTTPAGAGPTHHRQGRASEEGNHPRWRGADLDEAEGHRLYAEPPPLARGRLIASGDLTRDRGTTPAGAGPTACTRCTCSP